MGRVSVETVYALLQEYKSQMDKYHRENRDTLGEILHGVEETNGRVNDHSVRLAQLERGQHVAVAPEAKDWKVIGAGVGAVVLAIWGAVEVLRIGLNVVAKVGTLLTGAR